MGMGDPPGDTPQDGLLGDECLQDVAHGQVPAAWSSDGGGLSHSMEYPSRHSNSTISALDWGISMRRNTLTSPPRRLPRLDRLGEPAVDDAGDDHRLMSPMIAPPPHGRPGSR